jgi:hypothetical protein
MELKDECILELYEVFFIKIENNKIRTRKTISITLRIATMIFIYKLLFKNESFEKSQSIRIRRIGAQHSHGNDIGRLWG